MITRNAESELVALCDSAEKNAVGIDAFPVPFFHTPEEMFSSGIDMDVVTVCTPNGLHAEHAKKALLAKKHVVIEKPMGLSKAECEEVIFTSMQVHKQVFCVMQNRYSPPSQWIKELIEKNILGKIYIVQVNCYWNRDERYYKKNDPANWKGKQELDGGTLFTQFSHFVDIMYWLFGDIKDITATFSDFSHHNLTDFEDSGIVQFSFVNGGMGSINYSTSVWDRNLESSLTVIGENGSIKIGGQYMNEVEFCTIKNYTMPELPASNPANDYGSYKGSASNHHYIIQNVVDTLLGRSTATTNALEGMKVVEIIERIYALRPPSLLKKK